MAFLLLMFDQVLVSGSLKLHAIDNIKGYLESYPELDSDTGFIADSCKENDCFV